MPLTLSYNGISLTFSRFFSQDVPRIEPQANNLSYSAYRTPNIEGEAFEEPFLWNVTAYCSRLDYDKLLVIRAESDRQRRERNNWQINLDDTTFPYPEPAPRTRAIVSGTSETTIAGTVDYVLYYARFKVWIPKMPEYRKLGRDWGVSFVMQEAGKFQA